jgi:hypothetical protein
MVELSDRVVEEAAREGEALLLAELVSRAERAHPERPGIDRDRLGTYAEALAERREVALDPDAFREELADRVTDDGTWTDREAIYDPGDDRLSRYPARWHEELGGSTDVTDYLAVLRGRDLAFVVDREGAEAGPGVQERELVDVVAVVGRVDRETARAALQEAREAGDVVEDADQHPEAGVYLPEDAGDLEGSPRNPR